MKRILILSLLCLFLAACSEEASPTLVPPATDPAVKTLYAPLKAVTTNSDGSVVKTLHTYDGGVLTEQLVYYNDQLQSVTAVRCDEYGRPVEKTSQQNEITVITYDDFGNVLTSTVTQDGKTILTEAYTYNSEGIPLSRLQTNAPLALTLRTVYRYENGKLAAEEAYSNDTLYTVIEYAYDETGALVSVTDYGPDHTITSWQELTYDTENRITTTTYYDISGQITGTNITTYDANSCITQTEMIYGTATMTTVYTYIPITVDADCPRKN